MPSAVATIYQCNSYQPIISSRYNNVKYQNENDEANRLTIKQLNEQLKTNKKISWELRDLVSCFYPDEDWEVIRREVVKLVQQGKPIPENSLISFRCLHGGKEYYYDIPVNRLPRDILIQEIKIGKMIQPNYEHKRKKLKKEEERSNYFPQSNKGKKKNKGDKKQSVHYQLRALNFW